MRRVTILFCLVAFVGASVVTDTATAAPGDIQGGWQQLQPAAPENIPDARSGHSMAYDEKRRETVLFGGAKRSHFDWEGLNDVWVLGAGSDRWAKRETSGNAPELRVGASFAYDPVRDEFVLFGGAVGPTWDCEERNDTWVLRPDPGGGSVWTWVPLVDDASSTAPSPRTGAGMAFDTGRQQMVLFGGDDCDWTPAGASAETWFWDGARWTRYEGILGPIARSDFAFARNYTTGRLVLFGGWEVWGVKKRDMNQTWSWGPDGWRQENPATSPSPRSNVGLAYNAKDQRLILFGGGTVTAEGGLVYGDTWSWNGADWTLESTQGPSPRSAPVAPSGDGKVVLFGGMVSTEFGHPTPHADTWVWNGPPSPSDGAATVTIALNPSTIDVDATSPTASTTTATVTVRKCASQCTSPNEGVPMPGQQVRLSTTGDVALGQVTDNRDGTYTAQITASKTPGVEFITASTLAGNATAALSEVAGPPARLTLDVAPAVIPADGKATARARMHAGDMHGNPVSGHALTLSTNGDVKISPITDDANGDYSATVTASNTNGHETLTASTANGVTAQAALTEYGAPVTLSLTLDPTELPANGTSTSAASMTIRDDEGILVPDPDETVTLATTGDVAISPVTSSGDGTFTATITASQTPGNQVITARSTHSELSASRPLLEAERAVMSVTDVSVEEGDQFLRSLEFRIRLHPANDRDLTFRYVTDDHSARAGSDYVPTAGNLTFAAGETEKTVVVRGVGDTEEEDSETFSLLVSPQGRVVLGDREGVGTIVDDDTPPVLKINDVFLEEGDAGPQNAIFNVTLDPASPTKTTTVRFETLDGTAEAGSDYVATSGTLEFVPNDTFEAVRVPVNGDLEQERDENFTVRLSDAGPAAEIADGVGTATIVNDDGVDGLLGERKQGGVVLSGHDPDEHAFGCPPPDCPTELDNTPSNPEGAQHIIQRSIAYVTGDMLMPRILSVSHRDKGEHGLISSGFLAIDRANHEPFEDDLDIRTVDLAEYDVVVVASTAYIEDEDVDILNSRRDDIVEYLENGGGLVAWEQSEKRSPFGFIPGLKSAPWLLEGVEEGLRVTPAGEAMGLTDEDVNGNIRHQYFAGSCGFDVIDIDSESHPITLASHEPLTACGLRVRDVSVDEGDGGTANATVGITIDDASEVPVRARYTTVAGTASPESDYQAVSGTVVFEPGETFKKIAVPISGDVVPEETETFTVRLSDEENALVARRDATVTILDTDRPAVSVDDVAVTEGSASGAQVTVSLSQPPVVPVDVGFETVAASAAVGNDFDAVAETLRFDRGATSQTLTVPVLNDERAEPLETFNVRLSGVTNATVADDGAVVTITDDDRLAVTITDAEVSEGDGEVGVEPALARFVVSLGGASAAPVQVGYATAGEGTALPGEDYEERNGSLNFGAGESEKSFTVPVLGDTAPEPAETFAVVLSVAEGVPVADGQATGTILDDDEAPPPETTTTTTLPPVTTTTAPPVTTTTTAAPGEDPQPELAQLVPPLIVLFTPPPPLEPLIQPLPQPSAQPVTQTATQPNPQPQTQSNPQPQSQTQPQNQVQQQAQTQTQAQSQAASQAAPQAQAGFMVNRQREHQVERAMVSAKDSAPQTHLASDRRSEVPATQVAWWSVLTAFGMAVLAAQRYLTEPPPSPLRVPAHPRRRSRPQRGRFTGGG